MRLLTKPQPTLRPTAPPCWSRVLIEASRYAIARSQPRQLALPVLMAVAMFGTATRSDAQTTIFTENVGTPTATTLIPVYSNGTAPATFQNKGVLTYAGSGDARATAVSNTYAGASGGGNIFLTSPGPKDFEISGISTTGYSTFTLAFGVNRSAATQTLSELALEYSSDGTTYTAIPVPLQTAAQGWIKLTLEDIFLPATSNLRLRWRNNSTAPSAGQQLRLDDISLIGNTAPGTDTTPPVITSHTPANNATNVAANTNLVAVFNEAIVANTGNVVITKTAGSVVAATIPITDPQISISGTTLMVNPTSNLDLATGYSISITPGAVKDTAGNSFAGITNATNWTFTTIPPDVTKPQIVSFSPANQATGIAPPAKLVITFDEPIDQAVFEEISYIIVKNSAGVEVASADAGLFAGAVTVDGAVATVTLSDPLDYDASYYVEIDPGAFVDKSGNEFDGFTGNSTWAFTTATVPTITTGPGYTQDFSTFTSATNLTDVTSLLPTGWAVSGIDLSYDGDFGVSATGGFRGNSNVLAYQHTGSTGVLVETLTLRNASAAPINNIVVSYRGRDNGPATGTVRHPIFLVKVAGTDVPELSYTTSSGNDVLRTANITGLDIPVGGTFSITWSSDGPNAPGSSSRRQIGISAVSVVIGSAQFAPSVTGLAPLADLTATSAGFSATVVSEGSTPITTRGFVYALTATSAVPALGGAGVTNLVDPAVGGDPFTASVSGLTPNTSYTVRSYATNSIGTSYSAAVTFTTLVTPPIFTGTYEQPFDDYTGANPAGWKAVSSGGAQGYAGLWGNTSAAAGFTGGVNSPGVLGYQHTGTTGILTTTLSLVNGTGAVITELPVSYLGRASRTTETRSPGFAVSVNGTVVPALAYSTLGDVDQLLSTTVTGLNIAPGATFTISWASARGDGGGSSKQIGLGEVVIGTPVSGGNTYATWAAANANGQGSKQDFDNDGITNGVEYFMGASGSTFTPNPGIVDGKITWPKDANFSGTYAVQTSTDLVIWTDVASTVVGNTIQYTPAATAKTFIRLKVVPVP